MILSLRWFIREFFPELIALLFLVLAALVPRVVWAQSLYQACPFGANDWPERTEPQAAGVAYVPREIIRQEYRPPKYMANNGFTHMVGMLNAATMYPCDRGRAAQIEIRNIRLIRVGATGNRALNLYIGFPSTNGYGLRYWTFYRSDAAGNGWFLSGAPPAESQPVLSWIANNQYLIDLRSIPGGIFHTWTHPRIWATVGEAYVIELEVRITGDAMLQGGVDYWRGLDSVYSGWSAGCLASNNCEAWLSHWYGDTGGKYIRLTLPGAAYFP
jgi:hypothetical protein